ARAGLVIARSLQDRQEIIGLQINLASCLQTAERLPVCQEALVIAREIKSHELCCLLLTHIGVWYMDTDEFAQAEPYLREALLIAQQIGHRQWICAVLPLLTIVLCEKREYEEAKTRLEEALTLAKMLEIPRSMCLALEAEGTLALALSQTDTALGAF